MKDVVKLSPHHQTSSLEAFHSVILRFAPKNVVFPFIGMLCRLYLAALHFNENANRPQAKTRQGDPLYKLSFPKAKKGECCAKPVKTQATFGYIDAVTDLIFGQVLLHPQTYIEGLMRIPVPQDLAAEYHRPAKEDVISGYVSRFREGAF